MKHGGHGAHGGAADKARLRALRVLRVSLLCGFVGHAAAQPATPPSPVVRYAAPALAGDSLRVGPGHAPALVAVFATWCRECRVELAALDTLRRRWEPRGVRVVALSVDEGSADWLRRWVAERKVAVPVAHDSVGAILRALGVVTVPTAVVVDGEGRVRWLGRGTLRTTAPGLAPALRGVAPRTPRPNP